MENDESLIIKPTSDLFTAVLWSAPKNEPILRAYINAVLTDAGRTPITKATVLNPFNIKEFAADKAITLDVRVEDEDRRLYDIEVQTASHVAFPNRVLHYWSNTYSSQLRIGGDYSVLRPVISIILTEFAIFPELKNLHNVFRLTAVENPDFVLTNDLQIHFVRLSDVLKGHFEKLKNVHRELRHWVNFFVFGIQKEGEEMTVLEVESRLAKLVDNDPLIMEAYRELRRFSSNPEMRIKEQQRQWFLTDYHVTINTARAEGLAEGLAEGEAKGKAEGEVQMLLRVLQARFGKVPADISHKISAIQGTAKLNKLADVAATCGTLEDFVKKLK